MNSKYLLAGLALVVCVLPIAALAQNMGTDDIPYGYHHTEGIQNPTIYTFTAANTGPVDAYFAGSTAEWTETLGMMVNGTTTISGQFTNQTTRVGTMVNLAQNLPGGQVNAGDTLTFFITINNSLGGGVDGVNISSDPTLNTGVYAGQNHVYAAAHLDTVNNDYVGSDFGGGGNLKTIPVGMFVAFEDNYPTDPRIGTTTMRTSSSPIPPAPRSRYPSRASV